jgi:hypothetical protein
VIWRARLTVTSSLPFRHWSRFHLDDNIDLDHSIHLDGNLNLNLEHVFLFLHNLGVSAAIAGAPNDMGDDTPS